MNQSSLAVKALIVHKGNILLVKRQPNDPQKPGMWEFPGGRLNVGEDPFDGLKREVKEETNIDIDVLQPTTVSHFTRADKQVITLITFFCKAKTTGVKLSEEHTDYKWSPISECKATLGEFFHKDVDAYNRLKLEQLL